MKIGLQVEISNINLFKEFFKEIFTHNLINTNHLKKIFFFTKFNLEIIFIFKKSEIIISKNCGRMSKELARDPEYNKMYSIIT